MAKTALPKTNVIRILESAGVTFVPHTFDGKEGTISAQEIAGVLGIDPAVVFKTLVTTTEDKRHFVFAIPACSTLDLKKAAKAAHEKTLDMLPLAQLFALTGYKHGGCSPIGMKHAFPTFIDETAQLYERIYLSGGKIGLNVEVEPDAIAALIPATFADLTR